VQRNPLPIHIESVAQYERLIQETCVGQAPCCFRGENNVESDKALLPVLLHPRNAHIVDQNDFPGPLESPDYARTFRETMDQLMMSGDRRFLQSEEDLSAADYIAWICTAHLEGVPTLLLDWSLNPFTALLFACRSCPHEQLNSIGEVWQMTLKPMHESEHLTIHLDKARDSDQMHCNAITKILQNGLPLNEPIAIHSGPISLIDADRKWFIYSCRPEPINQIPSQIDRPWTDLQCIARIEGGDLKERIQAELLGRKW
jgi:hypothetical protein